MTDPRRPFRVGVISFDATIITLVREAGARHKAMVDVFGSLAEAAAKGKLANLRVLIVDADCYAVSSEEIATRIESLTPTPSVLIVGGSTLAHDDAKAMGGCVKRFVVREGGGQVLKRALEDVLTACLIDPQRPSWPGDSHG